MLIIALATIAAAFSGSWYAFKLQNRHEKREQIRRNIEASNRAIYTVYDLWNVQKQYLKEIVLPYKGKDDAWLNMSPTVKGMHEIIKFNVSNLGFLLSAGKPNVYVNLLLEEKRYRILLYLIEERSELVFGNLNPKLESLGCQPGAAVDQGALETHLGPDLMNKLKILTDSIISHVEENTASLESLQTKLQEYLAEIYPSEKFITVQFSLRDKE